MKRGIRTLREVAHYVRYIPYLSENHHHFWMPPPVTLTVKAGTVQDHALLMASMFRSVEHEEYRIVLEAFKKS